MKSNASSENHIINNLKAIINFENFFQSEKSLKEIKRQDIIKFLDSKIKPPEIDIEKKWITTWNHYLTHLKSFFRGYTMRITEHMMTIIIYRANQCKIG